MPQHPAKTHSLIARAYSAFNRRDIAGALALMGEHVSWPKASEGGRGDGKEEVGAYWKRQWKEFDSHVEPLELIEREGGKVHVRVHQRVESLGGDVLWEGEIWHIHTVADGLLQRMDLNESEATSDLAPSAAFSKR